MGMGPARLQHERVQFYVPKPRLAGGDAGASRKRKRPIIRQPEPETDEERARRRMEMLDDSGSDSVDEASGDCEDDSSSEGDGDGRGARGASRARFNYMGDGHEDDEGAGSSGDDGEEEDEEDGEGSEEDSDECSDGGSEEPHGAAPLDWRASLADVAFEDIEKLRKDGARVQPLAKRAHPADKSSSKQPRLSKNRPSEVTSKRPVGRLRLAHGFDAGALKEKSARRIDPRFEPLAGKLDEAAIRQRYAFVYEQAEAEAAAMRRQLREHRAAEAKPAAKRRLARKAGKLLAPERVAELQRQADQRTSLLSAKARADRERQVRAELRKKELALVAQGKRPFYAKKGVLKDAVLTKQYDELKRAGKLGVAVAERRKRRANKQRKWMPTGRAARDGGRGGGEEE